MSASELEPLPTETPTTTPTNAPTTGPTIVPETVTATPTLMPTPTLMVTPTRTATATPGPTYTPSILDVQRDFGAKCDDTTDDTAAIRAAVAAAGPNATIYVPCGICRVTKQAENAAIKVLTPQVTIRGESRDCAVLKFADDTTDTALIGVATDGASPEASFFTLQDLTLDGNGANWGATGSHIGVYRGTQGTADHGRIQNVAFKNFSNDVITTSDAIRLDRTWNDWTVQDCQFLGNRRGADALCNTAGTECRGLLVSHNYFDQTNAAVGLGDFDIQVAPSASTADGKLTGVTVEGNICEGTCGGRCIVLSSVSYATISGNLADGCHADQIIVSQLAGTPTTHDVTVTGNIARNGKDAGFGFETATGELGPAASTFTGNVATRNGSVGLFLVTTQDVLVTGNIFDGNGTADLMADAGVYLTAEVTTYTNRRTQLVDNQYIDSGATPTQKYGIQIPAELVDGTVIRGGVFANNTTKPIAIANSAKVTNTLLDLPDVATVLADLSTDFSRAADGSRVYVSDAQVGTDPCAGSGSGAIAVHVHGAWMCEDVQLMPTPTMTAIPTVTATPTQTPASTETATPTPSAAMTATATPPLTPTSTVTPTSTPIPTATVTATQTTTAATPTVLPTPTAVSTPAEEDGAARKCRGATVAASAALMRSEAKVESACAGKILSGALPRGTTCRTEVKTADAIGKMRAKLARRIARACGGKDGTCGSGHDDVPLAAAGWDIDSCPNIEGGTCSNTITDCAGIATCLTCIVEAALDQAIGLYYDPLVPTDPKDKAEKALNKCRKTIGGATTTFLIAESKALETCWEMVNAGKASGACPAADGKAVEAIAKAESKKVIAICKACGGTDKVCGGAEDVAPAAIGFAATCPDLGVPGAPSCGGTITTLQDIVACVDCVTESMVDCPTFAAVPGLARYPIECVP